MTMWLKVKKFRDVKGTVEILESVRVSGSAENSRWPDWHSWSSKKFFVKKPPLNISIISGIKVLTPYMSILPLWPLDAGAMLILPLFWLSILSFIEFSDGSTKSKYNQNQVTTKKFLNIKLQLPIESPDLTRSKRARPSLIINLHNCFDLRNMI